jgi:ABC-type multidrug transport system permease subunit
MYKLSRKYIVISPKPKSRVSGFFATLVLSGVAAAIVGLYEKSKTAAVSESLKATPMAESAAATTVSTGASLGSIALWFLAGALFALIILMLLRKVVRR